MYFVAPASRTSGGHQANLIKPRLGSIQVKFYRVKIFSSDTTKHTVLHYRIESLDFDLASQVFSGWIGP